MSGGPWVAWIMLGAAPAMLLYARLHDPKGWRAAWAFAWRRTRSIVELCATMAVAGGRFVAAGWVTIGWWWWTALVRAVRFRHIRQETR